MVSVGCYLIVADTILGHFDDNQTPRDQSKVLRKGNEPLSALAEYLREVESIRDRPRA